MQSSQRPCRYHAVLAGAPDHQVKRLHIKPGKHLHLQRQLHGATCWYVMARLAVVTTSKK
ncbi:hypothetical protein C2W62_25740 [Candidatus Entotheonella serta]|nr:hypothetical protein C2W62_25740 [Candidatus Entotheonella serta]